MSLIAFHKFLIVTAILFSLGLAARQFSDFQGTGDNWALITALGFAGAALALVFYLARLRQFLKMPEPPFLSSQSEVFIDASLSSTDSDIENESSVSTNGHEMEK